MIQILKFLSTKTTNIAIASSSEYSIIQEVVERLDIEKYFPIIHSAEEEQYGKPHPAVYLSACKKIGVIPEECITFEDSLNGVISAKSAKITCIAVPEDVNKGNPKFAIADIILDSLEDF